MRTAVCVAAALAVAGVPAHAAPRLDRVAATPAVSEVTGVALSKDGRYAALAAYPTAPVEVAGVYQPKSPYAAVPHRQVYLLDRVKHTTMLVSTGKSGPGDDDSSAPAISADGRYVTFLSVAKNLLPGTPPTLDQQAYLYDRVAKRLTRVSVDWRGAVLPSGVDGVTISADGSTVVFWTGAPVLKGDGGGGAAVFARDRATGRIKAVTHKRTGAVARTYGTLSVSVSRTGRYVAVGGTVLGGDYGPESSYGNAYVFDTKTGTAKQLRGANADDARCPQQAADANVCAYHVRAVAIDAEGTQAAYVVETVAFFVNDARALSVDLASGEATTLVALPAGSIDGLGYTADGSAAYFAAPPHDSTAASGARVLYRMTVRTHAAVAISALPVPTGCRTDGCVTYRLASVAPFAGGVAFATDAPLTADDSDGLMDAYVATG